MLQVSFLSPLQLQEFPGHQWQLSFETSLLVFNYEYPEAPYSAPVLEQGQALQGTAGNKSAGSETQRELNTIVFPGEAGIFSLPLCQHS